MNRWILVALVCFGGGALHATAADPDQKALAQKRNDKLASPFLKKAPWLTDYDKARAEGRKTGKLIFAYFTRSYAT
jgi:hypothetical protein